MGDSTLSVLASSQAEGGNNFLVPNGTFFFVLAIFLDRARHHRHLRRAADPEGVARARRHGRQDRCRQQEGGVSSSKPPRPITRKAMKDARVQASSFRDDARAEGRKVVDDARAGAEQQVMSTLQTGCRAIEAGEGRRGTGFARQRGNNVGDPGQSNPRRRRHYLGRDEGNHLCRHLSDSWLGSQPSCCWWCAMSCRRCAN